MNSFLKKLYIPVEKFVSQTGRCMKPALGIVFILIFESIELPAQATYSDSKKTGEDPIHDIDTSASNPGLLERDNLTGDWGGGRGWLKEHGIILKPTLSQFYQGLTKGEGNHAFEYGAKADILLHADLDKLGLWKGLSLTVHAEYNFGNSVNGTAGVVVPVNSALYVPGMEGADAFDFSSVYLMQKFGSAFSLMVGKVNLVDLAANRPFMGGAGINAWWNATFAVPPSGTVPPYLFGALLTVKTKSLTYGFWIYDPVSVVNKSGFEEPFASGTTFRGTVDIPVTIAGRTGHQGFVALYSTMNGTDLEGLSDIIVLPPPPGTIGIKNSRYYFAYSFDQYLYRSALNPKEGIGIFGQFGISDGNPNPLHWSAFGGISGKGLIPGRSRDNWGAGYYYYAFSKFYKGSVEAIEPISDEQAFEVFYDFSFTPWLVLGANLQVIEPAAANTNAVFVGFRMVINL